MSTRPTTRITQRVVRMEVDGLELRVNQRVMELEITYVDLAERMGVAKSRVHAILHAGAIDLFTFNALAKALDWTAADWTAPLPPPPPSLEESARRRRERIKKTTRAVANR